MPKNTPSPQARRFLARRAASASTLNPAGRRVYLAVSLTQISEQGLSIADRAFVVANLAKLLVESREAA